MMDFIKNLHLAREAKSKLKYKIRKDGRIQALRDFGNIKKGDLGGVRGF